MPLKGSNVNMSAVGASYFFKTPQRIRCPSRTEAANTRRRGFAFRIIRGVFYFLNAVFSVRPHIFAAARTFPQSGSRALSWTSGESPWIRSIWRRRACGLCSGGALSIFCVGIPNESRVSYNNTCDPGRQTRSQGGVSERRNGGVEMSTCSLQRVQMKSRWLAFVMI